MHRHGEAAILIANIRQLAVLNATIDANHVPINVTTETHDEPIQIGHRAGNERLRQLALRHRHSRRRFLLTKTGEILHIPRQIQLIPRTRHGHVQNSFLFRLRRQITEAARIEPWQRAVQHPILRIIPLQANAAILVEQHRFRQIAAVKLLLHGRQEHHRELEALTLVDTHDAHHVVRLTHRRCYAQILTGVLQAF